jgi:capsular exopolysaccharide synthesis family protein
MLFFDSEVPFALGMEEFRTLRSRLNQFRAGSPLKKLLISSAVPAEGKSFVAANLAQALAKTHDCRVLLIDADLRSPHLHHYLGAPASPGLTDYLSGGIPEWTVIQRSPLPNLCFLPSGSATANAAEILARPRWSRLLEKTAIIFDWIIVDSPPVIPVSDATVLAEACDGVVIVVRAGSTPHPMVQRGQAEFRSTPLLGVVLNRAATKDYYGSHYYSQVAKDSRERKDTAKRRW